MFFPWQTSAQRLRYVPFTTACMSPADSLREVCPTVSHPCSGSSNADQTSSRCTLSACGEPSRVSLATSNHPTLLPRPRERLANIPARRESTRRPRADCATRRGNQYLRRPTARFPRPGRISARIHAQSHSYDSSMLREPGKVRFAPNGRPCVRLRQDRCRIAHKYQPH
ncbi:hypothetical protein K466DRAFT_387466 [Polyporus arcularius HHB13444]|uniref:WIF domain-containing protein n=1 Tax=Polyporus arcularius HHB13444 TaxID=1314778 RepID=A0A5C3NUQ0_9APHY|nr:hypothetical protein K466DRAFT_387466 [Polyporus arcularius HHB13444]